MGTPAYQELGVLPDDELIRRRDRVAFNTQPGLAWYDDELHRRLVARQTDTLVKLTWLIAALTVVNVVAVIVALFK